MKWIKSAGGPLICIETSIMSVWCGIDGAAHEGRCVSSRPNDYDRACAVSDYVGAVSVGNGHGLVLGDMPLATTVFGRTAPELYVIRAVYMEPGTEIAEFSDIFAEKTYRSPIEVLNFETVSAALSMFDSAIPGDDPAKDILEFKLLPGRYEIKTALLDPNEQTSLVLHRFDLQA